jgi:hypothetical protein
MRSIAVSEPFDQRTPERTPAARFHANEKSHLLGNRRWDKQLELMGPTGVEPATSCAGGKRSIQLSYGPVVRRELYRLARPAASLNWSPGALPLPTLRPRPLR